MVAVEADLVDVGRPEDLLVCGQQGRRRLLLTQEVRFRGCMPALMSSVDVSSGGGISGADGSRVWLFSSKKRRKLFADVAVVRTLRF